MGVINFGTVTKGDFKQVLEGKSGTVTKGNFKQVLEEKSFCRSVAAAPLRICLRLFDKVPCEQPKQETELEGQMRVIDSEQESCIGRNKICQTRMHCRTWDVKHLRLRSPPHSLGCSAYIRDHCNTCDVWTKYSENIEKLGTFNMHAAEALQNLGMRKVSLVSLDH